jgi:hypothetical protein
MEAPPSAKWVYELLPSDGARDVAVISYREDGPNAAAVALAKLLLDPVDAALVSAAFERRQLERDGERRRLLNSRKRKRLLKELDADPGIVDASPTTQQVLSSDTFLDVVADLFGGMLAPEHTLVVVRDLGGGKVGGVFVSRVGAPRRGLLRGPEEAKRLLADPRNALIILGEGPGNRTVALSRPVEAVAPGAECDMRVLQHAREALREAEAHWSKTDDGWPNAENAIGKAANRDAWLAEKDDPRLGCKRLDAERLKRVGLWVGA